MSDDRAREHARAPLASTTRYVTEQRPVRGHAYASQGAAAARTMPHSSATAAARPRNASSRRSPGGTQKLTWCSCGTACSGSQVPSRAKTCATASVA